MQFNVTPNWSEQYIYGDSTPGIFVGRKQERLGLKKLLENTNSSAILVSSIRGVGKTSFVHKALSDTDNITPIFVNIGHTLANKKIQENKKLILKSLIRAVRYSGKFEKSTIENLYQKSLGNYEETKITVNKSSEILKTSADLKPKPKERIKETAFILGTVITIFGLNVPNIYIRFFMAFIGTLVSGSGMYFSKEISNFIEKKTEHKKDNSTEYLEIEFETWLKKNQSKNIVFVIDELDKIGEEEALNIVKEYKNLFTRSFAHFIFIASQKAYELVQEDRKGDKGIFPTFFTNIIYLPLPKTQELREYLREVFGTVEKEKEAELERLKNYLLCKSMNDFFELKRLISGLLEYTEENAFIDTANVKDTDINYENIARLYEYTDNWFLEKNHKDLNKFAHENSTFQENTLRFINKYFGNNFNDEQNLDDIKNSDKLIKFLMSIGSLSVRKSIAEEELAEDTNVYSWTFKYKRTDPKAPLTEEDKEFRTTFRKMITLANTLDELLNMYEGEAFTNFKKIKKERDGFNYTSINLYETYINYLPIFNKLSNAYTRISITTSKVEEGTKTILEQMNNVRAKYFEIFVSFMNQIIGDEERIINAPIANAPELFNACPDFVSQFSTQTHSTYYLTDHTKTVLVLKSFNNYESIHKGLVSLIEQKNILIINLLESEKFKNKHPTVQIPYKDSLGRNRKKKVKVENFVNYKVSTFNDYPMIAKQLMTHLS